MVNDSKGAKKTHFNVANQKTDLNINESLVNKSKHSAKKNKPKCTSKHQLSVPHAVMIFYIYSEEANKHEAVTFSFKLQQDDSDSVQLFNSVKCRLQSVSCVKVGDDLQTGKLTWVRTPSARASAGLVGVTRGRAPTGLTLSSSLSTFALPLEEVALSRFAFPELGPGLPFSHPGDGSPGCSTSGSSSDGLVVTLAPGEPLGRSTITHSLESMSCLPELRFRATNPPLLAAPSPCSRDPGDVGFGEPPPDRNSSS